MTVKELASKLSMTEFCMPQPDNLVEGGYAGDLLSWVMSRVQPGNVWVTIMSNQNVAAVAILSEASCVVLAEEVSPDAELLHKAKEHGVNLLGSSRSVFSLCRELSDFVYFH
jgi:hypothetical protein